MSTDQPTRPGRDRRRGARFITVTPQANSTLIVGRTEFPASILDESAGGFCIQLDQDPRVDENAVVRLRTSLGCYEVRVANVGRDAENRQLPSYRLGLQRLRELEVIPLPTDRPPWTGMIQYMMPGTSMLGAMIFILAMIIVAPLTAVGVLLGLDKVSLQQLTDGPRSAGDRSLSRDAPYSLRKFLPDAVRLDHAGDRSTAVPGASSPNRADLPAPEHRRILAHGPAAEALLLPEVAQHLALSDSQQARLRELADATEQALDQFDQHTQADSRHERSRKRELLFNEARRQALRVLTAEQRARWNDLQTQ